MTYSCEITGNDRTLCLSDSNGGNSKHLVTIIRKEVPGVGWNIQPASAWSADGSWIYYASAKMGIGISTALRLGWQRRPEPDRPLGIG